MIVGSSPGSLTKDELHDIYFQNGGRLNGGQAVIPLDYKADNPLREQFYEKAFSRSQVQMKAYWAQRIFTGKGNPPMTVENAKEAATLILEKHENYIGYMNESDVARNMNVLLRLP
ncbi:MAG: hypothetical protein ACXVCI_09115 [Bdellovibrionota bacterium]